MPYCIYLRKSRADREAEARGEGESLARHETALLALAKSQGLNVTKIYREIVSGETISSRPEVQKMLREIEEGMWEGVLVMEVERLARGNTIDQGIISQAFQATDTKIITPIKIYDPRNEFDQEYFEFGLFMSRREFITINRRMQRGRIASVKEGNYLGSKPPFGYDMYRSADKRPTLSINKEQAPTVQLIYDLFTGDHPSGMPPMGCSMIMHYLNDRKIPSATGSGWTPSVIRAILTNPVYIGKIRWNNRQTIKKISDGTVQKHRPRAGSTPMVVDGIHPAIITEQQFQKVAELFNANRQAPGRKPVGTPSPLLKLVRCSCCGKNMVRRPQKNSRIQLICTTSGCPTVGAPLEEVEALVLKTLENWMENFKIANAATPEQDELKKVQAELSSIDRKLTTLSAQENKTYDLLEQGIYNTETFLSRQQQLTTQKETLMADRQTLLESKAHLEQISKGKSQLIPTIEYILANYDTATPEEKNKMLRRVINYVTYTKTKRMNPRTKTGGDLSISITPVF